MKTLYLFSVMCLLLSCNTQTDHPGNNYAAVPGSSKTTLAVAVPDESESIFNLTSTWRTEEGKEIRLGELKGKVLVMVMIYTTCQVACPKLVADMKSIHDKVPGKLVPKVQYVLVSIDPEHDTPEKLKAFAKSREMDGEEWTFLQGDPESVQEFANVLAVKYKEISPTDFSHSNIISVFNTAGTLVHQQEGLNMDNTETIQTIIKTTEQ